jgi:raffinose/stachyose/melibiose transport system permease protein
VTAKLEWLGTRALMCFAVLSIVIPLLVIATTALEPAGSTNTGLSWPAHPHWGNFVSAWSVAGFSTLMRSSAIICVAVVPVGVILATCAGYAFGTIEFPGKRLIFAALMIGLAVPYEAIVIALYYNLKSVGLTNTYLSVILPLIGAFMPFGAFWMRNHFAHTPVALIEAAQMDGASDFTILTKVLLPNSRAAISTLSVLYFMWTWNQFLLVLIMIQDPSRETAPLGLALFVGQYTTNLPLLSAGTLIVIAPVMIVYMIFQRQFIAGLAHGAIKG